MSVFETTDIYLIFSLLLLYKKVIFALNFVMYLLIYVITSTFYGVFNPFIFRQKLGNSWVVGDDNSPEKDHYKYTTNAYYS